MKKVRLGLIGLGNMGQAHASNLLAGKVPSIELTAVCDQDAGKFSRFAPAAGFDTPEALMASGLVDAVLVATPHYFHTTQAGAALQAGLHVLVEKPISVHKADCERLIAAHTDKRQVFAAMFNQRTDKFYQKIRAMIRGGELGEIRRVQWTITNWFRTEAYYASGGWRATWGGEGGGVLLNQSPHQLDLLWWLFGQPVRVRAHCNFGRYHNIEVEDDVTAYLEFANGATGVFITSTGEAPGTNRLEITGERGRLVLEESQLTLVRNAVPMGEFSRASTQPFAQPETAREVIAIEGTGGQHLEILANFAAAILEGAPLLSPAEEGIHSVEIANAMLLSAWQNQTVALPIDAAVYETQLKEKIAGSRFVKKTVKTGAVDLSASFAK